METEPQKDPKSVVEYRENFIPYRDGDDVLWAVYDARSDENLDGTTLLSKAIDAETDGQDAHLSVDRLQILANAYGATCLFRSTDENAVQNLQDLLGKDQNVHKFLAEYGFEGKNLTGFTLVPQQETSDQLKAPQTDEHIGNTAESFNSAGSVPIGDDVDWNNLDAAKLLRSALLFRHLEVRENKKGSIKEGISDALVFYTTATDATGPSTVATACGILAIALMIYQAEKDKGERDKILKIWANLQKNIENPQVSSAQAHDILKKEMHASGLAFEGVPQATCAEFDKHKSELALLADLKGYFLSPEDVLAAGNSLAGMGDRIKRIGRKTAYEFSSLVDITTEGVRECFTDLKVWEKETRYKLSHGIFRGTAVPVQDAINIGHNQKTLDAEKDRHVESSQALGQIKKKGSAIIDTKIDLEKIEEQVKILEEIPKIRELKRVAVFNYANVSTIMGAQAYSAVNHALKGDVIGVAYEMYGILMGIGAWAQTGMNVHKLDAQIHTKRAEEANLHPHYIVMKEHLNEEEPEKPKSDLTHS